MSYRCRETLGRKPAHIICRQTGITGLPCSAPGFNHYIRTHALSLTIWQEHPRKRAEKGEKRESYVETHTSLHAAIYLLTRRMKSSATESGNLWGKTFTVFFLFQWGLNFVACGELCMQVVIVVLPWQQVWAKQAHSIPEHSKHRMALFPIMMQHAAWGKTARCRLVGQTVLVCWLCMLDWARQAANTLWHEVLRRAFINTIKCWERGLNMKLKTHQAYETAEVLTTPLWDLVLTSSFRIPYPGEKGCYGNSKHLHSVALKQLNSLHLQWQSKQNVL